MTLLLILWLSLRDSWRDGDADGGFEEETDRFEDETDRDGPLEEETARSCGAPPSISEEKNIEFDKIREP